MIFHTWNRRLNLFFSYSESQWRWRAWPPPLFFTLTQPRTILTAAIKQAAFSLHSCCMNSLPVLPPFWPDKLAHCMCNEGVQRSTELSAQFYATSIFQDVQFFSSKNQAYAKVKDRLFLITESIQRACHKLIYWSQYWTHHNALILALGPIHQLVLT